MALNISGINAFIESGRCVSIFFLIKKIRNINWLILNIEIVFLLTNLVGRLSSPLDRLIPRSTCIVISQPSVSVGGGGGWRLDPGPPQIPKSMNAQVPYSWPSVSVGSAPLDTEGWLYLYLILIKKKKKMIKWMIFDGRVTWCKVNH